MPITVPKELLENLQLLSTILVDAAKEVTDEQKQQANNFLASCIGNSKINIAVLANKRHLADKGVNLSAINAVLDLSFSARRLKEFDAAYAMFQKIESTEASNVEVLRNFAVLSNVGSLSSVFESLSASGLIGDGNAKLTDLQTKSELAKKIIDSFELSAKKIEGHKPGFFQQESAHSQILAFFQRVNKYRQSAKARPIQPKG